MDWQGMKGVVADTLVDKDALHIYAAFVIQLGAAFAFRRTLASWLPWIVVLAFLLINEYLDIRFGEEAHVQPWQLFGAAHDLVNTMLLPTALMLLVRVQPSILQPVRGPGVDDEGETQSEQAAEENPDAQAEDEDGGTDAAGGPNAVGMVHDKKLVQ